MLCGGQNPPVVACVLCQQMKALGLSRVQAQCFAGRSRLPGRRNESSTACECSKSEVVRVHAWAGSLLSGDMSVIRVTPWNWNRTKANRGQPSISTKSAMSVGSSLVFLTLALSTTLNGDHIEFGRLTASTSRCCSAWWRTEPVRDGNEKNIYVYIYRAR